MGTILHCKGGLTSILEEEVMSAKPPHDDLRDALELAVENSKKPGRFNNHKVKQPSGPIQVAHNRFGGRRRV